MGFYDGKPSYNLIRDRMLTSFSKQAQSNRTPAVPTESSATSLQTLM